MIRRKLARQVGLEGIYDSNDRTSCKKVLLFLQDHAGTQSVNPQLSVFNCEPEAFPLRQLLPTS
jgi:hypothetical protein